MLFMLYFFAHASFSAQFGNSLSLRKEALFERDCLETAGRIAVLNAGMALGGGGLECRESVYYRSPLFCASILPSLLVYCFCFLRFITCVSSLSSFVYGSVV